MQRLPNARVATREAEPSPPLILRDGRCRVSLLGSREHRRAGVLSWRIGLEPKRNNRRPSPHVGETGGRCARGLHVQT